MNKEDRLPVSYATITLGQAVRHRGVLIGLLLKSYLTEWHTPYSILGYPLAPVKTALEGYKSLLAEYETAVNT